MNPPTLTLGHLSKRVREVAQLWRTAMSRPPHPAGCQCMGLFLIPSLNPKDMESDILDYLHGRYVQAGNSALAHMINERIITLQGASVPFRAWLADMAENNCADTETALFLDDLEQMLLPLAGTASKPTTDEGRFLCY